MIKKNKSFDTKVEEVDDFCEECISTWLSRKKTCPICLKDLDEN